MGVKRKAIVAELVQPNVRKSQRNIEKNTKKTDLVKKKTIDVNLKKNSEKKVIKTKNENKNDEDEDDKIKISSEKSFEVQIKNVSSKNLKNNSDKNSIELKKNVKQNDETVSFNNSINKNQTAKIKTYGKINNVKANELKVIEQPKTVKTSKRISARNSKNSSNSEIEIIETKSNIDLKKISLEDKKNTKIDEKVSKTSLLSSNKSPVKIVQNKSNSVVSDNSEVQKKIIINKIIMPPDAFNKILKQNSDKNDLMKTTAQQNTQTKDVPVQDFFKNLQANLNTLKPVIFSSGIKILPNSTTATTSNITNVITNLPKSSFIQLPNTKLDSEKSNVKTISSQPVKKMPIIITKSIMNPGTTIKITSPNKVNPITTVHPITTVKNPTIEKPTISIRPVAGKNSIEVEKKNITIENKTPEKNNSQTKNQQSKNKKMRVSFSFERNTCSSKPVSNDLPIQALMTSTPKQSIIKKPRVFDLPCTPITEYKKSETNLLLNKPTIAKDKIPEKITVHKIIEQVKNRISETSPVLKSVSNLKFKCCKANECNCYDVIPLDEIDTIKKVYEKLNSTQKLLYIYCCVIKINEDAKYDFERYVFHLKTSNGYIQVCQRVFMEVFQKSNLAFVNCAIKKFENF